MCIYVHTIDLDSPPCHAPSKIIGVILKRHPLKDALTLFSSAPVIYMQQLYYTLQLVNSKESFNSKLDQQQYVEFTMAYLRTMLNLPQATYNNHVGFIDPPELMTIFEFLSIIGHGVKVQALGKIFIKYLHQQWQTLCKVPSRCLTTRITRLDQASMATLHIFYLIINKGHVDYAKLIFDASGNVDEMGIRILNELLTKDIRGIAAYKLYDDDFSGIQVPMTQPSPAVSTHETCRKPNIPRTPNLKCIPKKEREQAQRESSAPIPKLNYAEAISAKEAEEKENLVKVKKAILVEEVDKIVEGYEEEVNDTFDDSFILNQEDPH
ncbi:hypothetical protein Tco_0736481 [Tanacetum coccineum]